MRAGAWASLGATHESDGLDRPVIRVDCPRCGTLKIDRMEWDYIHSPWSKDHTS